MAVAPLLVVIAQLLQDYFHALIMTEPTTVS